ncbi:SDR family oxidoreductase [Fictibacillus sp. KU28468]|uniref:SDR family oxidoreductase n=1 Tax=Fictibacillus sp. KU28468 TaxID=2991053 RepID=UPI00223C99A7|nr:SDR family oxidoreductase [Fictibacillus sp. KU28468]UZJ78454.1 SDR family oxidoreductase [Fictibacillus sp. KU28468]
MKGCLLTGYPGFLASKLLKEMQQRNEDTQFALIVHPSQLDKAERLAANKQNVRLFAGDITKDGLDLDAEQTEWLKEHMTHVFHLAAVYDLAVPKKIAEDVNITGTRNVNTFAQSLPLLERYIYFSTAYVSGKRVGVIKEDELDQGQTFKNHYESTKFEAEKLVAELKNVPYTIIRPGVVVGHSVTGETVKFDGPYFIMRFLDRLRYIPIPYLGKSEALFNVVPADYIVDATLCLAQSEDAVNRTFHLTDPSPYESRELYRMVCNELLGKTPSWTISPALVEFALSISIFRRFFKVEKEALEYFRCTSQYDASGAKDVLAKGGVQCPDFKNYVSSMVKYYKVHRRDPDKLIQVK